MKKLIIGLIIGFILGTFINSAIAGSTYINEEAIWNRVFNSSTNTLTIIGQ